MRSNWEISEKQLSNDWETSDKRQVKELNSQEISEKWQIDEK